MLCGFSSLWWPFGCNWSYLAFLGIIWRTCGSKCRGEGGGIFLTLCVECCLVVVNFDALAQASDIRIERRQVVFLCWEQDSNPSGSQTPNRQQTECPLTNRLSYRGSSYKTWTRQPVPMISEHSAHLTPQPFGIRTWLWRYTCLLLLISMLWHRQEIFESKRDKLVKGPILYSDR